MHTQTTPPLNSLENQPNPIPTEVPGFKADTPYQVPPVPSPPDLTWSTWSSNSEKWSSYNRDIQYKETKQECSHLLYTAWTLAYI